MSDEVNNRQEGQEASLSELLQIRRDKLAELQKQGKDPFQITKYNVTHHSNEVKDRFDELEGQTVSVAGRLMSKRGMGKAVFADLQDVGGRVQLYVRIDDVGEEASRSTTSATSWAWRARPSAPSGARFPSKPRP